MVWSRSGGAPHKRKREKPGIPRVFQEFLEGTPIGANIGNLYTQKTLDDQSRVNYLCLYESKPFNTSPILYF